MNNLVTITVNNHYTWESRWDSHFTLFPREIKTISLDTKNEVYPILDAWNGTFGVAAFEDGDNYRVMVIRMGYAENGDRFLDIDDAYEFIINKKDAVCVHIKKFGQVEILSVRLPRHLNDRVLWALGLKSWNRIPSAELDSRYKKLAIEQEDMIWDGEIQPGPCYFPSVHKLGSMDILLERDGYGEVSDVSVAFDGFLKKSEAIEILEGALIDCPFAINSARIKYVLSQIR